MTVRVGVVGTGIMGSDHARQLQHWVPGSAVTAVTDLDTVRAAAVAEELGAAAVPDAAALIGSAEVDAVVIASHDSTHVELVRACVAAGKPVLCEKPLAPTLSEASELAAELGEGGAELVSLGFMRRFDPGYVAARDLLRSGDLGRALLVHATGRNVANPTATSESSITGSSIHDLDIVPWLLASPVVSAAWFAGRSTGAVGEQLVDPQVLLLRTADGVLTTVETFINARYGYDTRCEVVGENGTVSIAEPTPIRRDTGLARSMGYPADWRPRFAEAYRLELTAWIRAVAQGRHPGGDMATVADGVQALAVAQALITSMRSGGAFTPVS